MQTSHILDEDTSLNIEVSSDGEIEKMSQILERLGDKPETFDRDMIYGGLETITKKLTDNHHPMDIARRDEIVSYVDGNEVKNLHDLQYRIRIIKESNLPPAAEVQLLKQSITSMSKILLNLNKKFLRNEINKITNSLILQLESDEYLKKLLGNQNVNTVKNYNQNKDLKNYLKRGLNEFFALNITSIFAFLAKSPDEYFFDPLNSRLDLQKLNEIFNIDQHIIRLSEEFHKGIAKSTINRKLRGSDYDQAKIEKALSNVLNGSVSTTGFVSETDLTKTAKTLEIIREFAGLLKMKLN